MRVLVLCSVMLGVPLLAQNDPGYGLRPGGIEVGLGVGEIAQGAAVEDGPKMSLDLHMLAGVSQRLSVGLRFTTTAYNNASFLNTRRYEIGSTLNTTMGEARYEFRKPTRRWAPFLTGGVGGLEFKNFSATGPDTREIANITNELRITSGWQFAYTAGAGVNVNITKKLGVELGYRTLKAQHTNWFSQPTATLYYRFQ